MQQATDDVSSRTDRPLGVTKSGNPFFNCGTDDQQIFSVQAGIPFTEAMNASHMLLDSARAIMEEAAFSMDGCGQPDCRILYGVAYLIEAAEAASHAAHAATLRGAKS